MHNYIKRVKVNILLGKFDQEVFLSPGLNVVAGVNGSGKTEFLKYLQKNISNRSVVELADNSVASPPRISVFMPKRNAEKIAMEQAYQRVKQDINIEQNTLNVLRQEIQDLNFQTIRPIAEYLVMSAQRIVDQDNKPSEAADRVLKTYQDVLAQIFDYKLSFSWDPSNKRYTAEIIKDGFHLTFNQLSSGENSIISLIFAIFYSKDDTDIYLIDEPEVHLNWQLEERLFRFLDWFGKTNNKQLIVATHSRACFIKPFFDYTKFFVWDSGKIVVKEKPDKAASEALSGDVVKIIDGITTQDRIVYVEDKRHAQVVEKIAKLQGKSVEVTILGNRDKVMTQAKAFKKIRINNVYFLIDEDNKPLTLDERNELHNYLVQLKKYCVENYFLNSDILSAIDKSSPKKNIMDELFNLVRQVNTQAFKPIKVLLKDKGSLTAEVLDRLDASTFIENLASQLGFSDSSQLIEAYIEEVSNQGKLPDFFPEIVNEILA